MDETPIPLERLLVHRAWVRRVACALVADGAAAQDLEQDAWRVAIENGPKEERSIRRWFRVVLRNGSMNFRRSTDRRRAREQAVARPEGTRPTVDLVAEAEAHKRVVVAVMELEEPYRTTILLRFFEDLPPAGIADRMGVPLETVRTRLKRGIARLREALGGRGRSRSAGLFVLLPLVRSRPVRPTAAAVPAALVTGTGVLLMAAKTKVAVGAALVLVAVLAGWWAVSPSGSSGDSESHGPGVPSPVASVGSSDVPADGAPTPPAAVAEEPGPHFRGVVIGPDGKPVAGALVVAASDVSAEAVDPSGAAEEKGPGRAARTDAKGTFSLPAPTGVVFGDLVASAEGFSPGTLRSARPGDGLRIVLDPEAALVGRVMDLDGKPVAGARLCWLGTVGSVRVEREGVSGVDGEYRVAGIPGPTSFEWHRHWVEATATGFAPQFVGVEQAAPEAKGDRRLDVWMLRGATLRGRVVDAEEGRPLPGARVFLVSIEGATGYRLPDGGYAGSPWSNRRLGETVADGQGAFVFENVPAWGVRPTGINTPGAWERVLGNLGAIAEGYAPMAIRIPVPREGEAVTMDVKCWPEAFVEGRVVDAEGAPVAGAHVFLMDEERPSWGVPAWISAPGRPAYDTGPDGRYRIGWIPAPRRSTGTVEVMARGPLSSLWDTGPSETVQVTGASASPVPDLVLGAGRASPCIELLVVDEAGDPVPGAQVFQSGSNLLGRTAGDGTARVCIRGEKPVSDRLTVTHPGFANGVTEEVSPSKEEPPKVRVVLHPGRRLSGRVVRPDGTPVVGAGVTVADGSLPVKRLFTGDRSTGEAWSVVSMIDPAPPGGADLAFASTDSDGRFSSDRLPEGPWHVCAWKFARVPPPGKPSAVRVITASVPTGTADLVLVLDAPPDAPGPVADGAKPFEGTVRDLETGKPVLKFQAWMNGEGPSKYARSVAPGRFRFEDVPPGTWSLWLEAEGYDSVHRAGIVVGTEGPAAPLDFVLDSGVTLRGVLRFPAADGTPTVRLLLYPGTPGGPGSSADPGTDGRFEVRGLRRGARYLPALVDLAPISAPGSGRRTWVPAGDLAFTAPAAGGTVSVEWNLVPAGCLYVGADSPRLLPGGSLELATEDQKRTAREAVVEVVDPSGTVVARGNLAANNHMVSYLPPGNYTVRVTLPGEGTLTKQSTLGTEMLKVDFEIP